MIYARIQDGVVVEVIDPLYWPEDGIDADGNITHKAGDEVAIAERFTPAFVAMLVDITNISPKPDERWTYNGTTFSPPA